MTGGEGGNSWGEEEFLFLLLLLEQLEQCSPEGKLLYEVEVKARRADNQLTQLPAWPAARLPARPPGGLANGPLARPPLVRHPVNKCDYGGTEAISNNFRLWPRALARRRLR